MHGETLIGEDAFFLKVDGVGDRLRLAGAGRQSERAVALEEEARASALPVAGVAGTGRTSPDCGVRGDVQRAGERQCPALLDKNGAAKARAVSAAAIAISASSSAEGSMLTVASAKK